MNLVEWVSIAKKYTKTTTFTYRTRFFLSRCDVTIYSFFLLFSFPFSVHSKIGGKKCSYNAILVTAHSFMNIVFAFANHRRFVVGRFFFDASTISTQWVLSLTLYFRNDAHFFPLLQWRFFRPSLFNKLQFSSCTFTFSQFDASPSRLHLNGN